MILKSNKRYNLVFHGIYFYRPNSNEISMANEYQVDHPYDNHISDDDNDDLSNDEQEKEFEEKFKEIEIDQVQSETMPIPTDIGEMTEPTSVRKKLDLLSKIPLVSFVEVYNAYFTFANYRFYRKSKNSKKPPVRRLKITEIFRFSNKIDILLMLIGSITG
jgi:hypothetical protein